MNGNFSTALRDGVPHRVYHFDLGAGSAQIGTRSVDFNMEGLCSFVEIQEGITDVELLRVDAGLFAEANRKVFELAAEIVGVLIAGCE